MPGAETESGSRKEKYHPIKGLSYLMQTCQLDLEKPCEWLGHHVPGPDRANLF
jgi:hypothetical protein